MMEMKMDAEHPNILTKINEDDLEPEKNSFAKNQQQSGITRPSSPDVTYRESGKEVKRFKSHIDTEKLVNEEVKNIIFAEQHFRLKASILSHQNQDVIEDIQTLKEKVTNSKCIYEKSALNMENEKKEMVRCKEDANYVKELLSGFLEYTQTLKEQMKELNNYINNLQKMTIVEEFPGKIEELKKQLQTLKNGMNNSCFEDVNKKYEQFIIENNDLKINCSEFEHHLQGLMEQKVEIIRKIEDMENDIKECLENPKELSSEVMSVLNELCSLKQKEVDNLKNFYAQKLKVEHELDHLLKNYELSVSIGNNMEKEIEKQKKNYRKREEEMNVLQAEINQLNEKTVEELKVYNYQELVDLNREFIDRNKAINKDIASLQKHDENLNATLITNLRLRQKFTSAQQKLFDLKTITASKSKELAKLVENRADLNEEILKKSEFIEAKEIELAALREKESKLAILELELKKSNEESLNTSSLLSVLEVKIKELSDKIKEIQAENVEKQEQMEKYKIDYIRKKSKYLRTRKLFESLQVKSQTKRHPDQSVCELLEKFDKI